MLNALCHESSVHFATQLKEATRLPNMAVVSDVKEPTTNATASAVCQPVEHDVPMLTAWARLAAVCRRGSSHKPAYAVFSSLSPWKVWHHHCTAKRWHLVL